MIVHQIPTKHSTEIRFNEPIKCAKHQGMDLYYMADFAKCAKRKERKKKNKDKNS